MPPRHRSVLDIPGVRERIKELVDAAPPLTAEQIFHLRAIIRRNAGTERTIMRTRAEIEAMARRAKVAAGWQPDGTRPPIEGDDAFADEARKDRAAADAAEHALLWVLGYHNEDPVAR